MSMSWCRYPITSTSRRCRLQRVLASSPKNWRRMSLSMPTTLSPFPAKNRAASAPMRPAEPVITATAILLLALHQYGLDVSVMLAQPCEDVVEYVWDRELRTPSGGRCHSRVVGHIERDVYWVGLWMAGYP